MAPRNLIPTERITISTNRQVKRLLGRLVRTGLYGKTEADAAERLVVRELERLLAEGRIPDVDSGPEDDESEEDTTES